MANESKEKTTWLVELVSPEGNVTNSCTVVASRDHEAKAIATRIFNQRNAGFGRMVARQVKQ